MLAILTTKKYNTAAKSGSEQTGSFAKCKKIYTLQN
jgi:hypothetical protein